MPQKIIDEMPKARRPERERVKRREINRIMNNE